MTDTRKTFRVGYFVTVDVEAWHESEAGMVGEAACLWPGDWRPPHDPVECVGVINGHTVTARIVRSEVLMVKPLP